MEEWGSPPEWRGRRVTVIGAGVSGRELALLASRLGARVLVSERGDLSDEARALFDAHGIAWEAGGHTERAFDADVLLLSSGIPPSSPAVQEARRRGLPLMGELDFVVPFLSGRLVAVTGSNGKSTVTALIGHTMSRLGWRAGAGGNLGTAAAAFVEINNIINHDTFDALALELSSFQLAWATRLGADISIVTNLAPDHINWHGSYEAYVAAKAKVLSLRGPGGWGIVQERDLEALGAAGAERIVTLSWDHPSHETAGHILMGEEGASLSLGGEETPLFRYEETSLLGAHNLENVAMALTAIALIDSSILNEHTAAELLEGFVPLPHRCADAGTVDGVLYVDDSKGTNVAASATAMTSLKGRKVVILGGRGKGEDYAPLAEVVLREAEAAVVLGEEAEPIAAALGRAGFQNVHRARDMEEAVELARSLARPGMTVLLSPACTSWDMYDNYGQRGDHFQAIVRALR